MEAAIASGKDHGGVDCAELSGAKEGKRAYNAA